METVGLGAAATLPNDQTELLKLLIIEVRVLQFYLKEGLNVTDEPFRLRQDLQQTTEIKIT